MSSPNSLVASLVSRQCRKSYTLSYKMGVVNEAKLTGNMYRTAKDNGLPFTNVSCWVASEKTLKAAVAKKKVKCKRIGGRITTLGMHTERGLVHFVRERRDKSEKVSVNMLKIKLRQLDPSLPILSNWSAIRQRVYRVLDRNNLCFRRSTHKAQENKSNESVATDFIEYVNSVMKAYAIPPARVVNADQTNIFFAPDETRTIADRGSQTVSIKQLPTSQRCSVMLGCAMNGFKLDPYVVFKGKNDPESGRVCREIDSKRGYPQNIALGVQEKAWMDTEKVMDWIDKVWVPFIEHGATDEARWYLLILDKYRAHMVREVMNRFAVLQTVVLHIPGGYTGRLQVMDVGINKPTGMKLTISLIIKGSELFPRGQTLHDGL